MQLASTNTVIFHHPKQNINSQQQIFLQWYKKHYPTPSTIIDYVGGSANPSSAAIAELIGNFIQQPSKTPKPLLIINSSLSEEQWDNQYDMYNYFAFLNQLESLPLYFLDSIGGLYQYLGNINTAHNKRAK
jgi:hypothetical protein